MKNGRGRSTLAPSYFSIQISIRLERDGYVKREANPADRRSCIVHLIPESLRKLEGAYKSKGEVLASAIEQYSDRDLRLLNWFFEQINRASQAARACELTGQPRKGCSRVVRLASTYWPGPASTGGA